MHNGYDPLKALIMLQSGDPSAFETIYNHFATRLYNYVYSRVRLREPSEEIVQEIFLSLWEKRNVLSITSSLESYLFGAAKHKILSYIRSEQVRKRYAAEFVLFAAERFDNSNEELSDLRDLERTLDEKIAELPDKCREVFRMSRVEHLPIQRIAEKMNISTRTVENYISQALRHLRTSIGEFLVWAVLVLNW